MNCDQYAEWLVENDPDNPDVQAFEAVRGNMIVCPNRQCGEVYDQ